MVKYPQMKSVAALVVAILVHASAFAGARAVVQSLPEATTPDCEVCTNIVLNVNVARLRTLTFSVSFDACSTNEVLIALGADANGDGDLSVDEADIVFGCDCGAWYRADLRSGSASIEGSDPTVEAGSLVVGRGEFDPAWNLVKVVRRGRGEIGETVEIDEERVRFNVRVR
jgi:hypothetical protein